MMNQSAANTSEVWAEFKGIQVLVFMTVTTHGPEPDKKWPGGSKEA